ncbi:MAG: methyltransferase domain-containing protein [Thermogemmatispora sp.]|uniref:class I SAM-dependent methyltransferase n=1 Tax=Thermogemmatispora sp. TaxID=1968838 RepID=UPI0019F0522A|nr:class I SAM-dependent methyltransferase [Thermogemmatispora sp.]MBE3568345.1 methyltransferase domain-containing protein [Thermogemmatispora sp.]
MNPASEQQEGADSRERDVSDGYAQETTIEQRALTREEATELVRQRYPAHADTAPCAACGSVRTAPFTWRRGFRIAECRECGFLWVDPMPRAEDMWVFYNRRRWQPYPPEVVRRKFRPELQVVLSCVPSGSWVVDVGCSHGQFASLLRARGYQVVGVDIDSEALAYASRQYGLQVYQGDLSLLSFDRQFDAVTILSSLEHMVNPFEVVAAAARMLRPGGALIISTPRGDGLIPSMSRRLFLPALGVWEFLSPPSHLTYFTQRSLAAMMRRAGFQHITFYDRARDRDYKKRELREALQDSQRSSSWVGTLYLQLRHLRFLARCMRRGDMMIGVGRKPMGDGDLN